MNVNVYKGRVATEIELKTTTAGKLVVSFDLAVKRPYAKDTTDFIRCVAWEQDAEFVSKYFAKGQEMVTRGYLTTRKYKDKDGKQRTVYEVICKEFSFCGEKPTALSANESAPQYSPYNSTADLGELSNDEDFPF